MFSIIEFAYCPEAMDYLNENYSYWKEEAERVVCSVISKLFIPVSLVMKMNLCYVDFWKVMEFRTSRESRERSRRPPGRFPRFKQATGYPKI